MPHQSDTELLVQRLDAILSEKAMLMKRVEELSAAEERIKYAIDVFRQVVGEIQEPSRVVSASSNVALNISSSGMLTTNPAPQPATDNRARATLESAILDVFSGKTGITSGEVADQVTLFTTAKRDSILSTLSRMTGKGLVRREKRLYFRAVKGEGSEVGTSEPSVATKSVEGRHTSGALTGEKGNEEL